MFSDEKFFTDRRSMKKNQLLNLKYVDMEEK